MSTELGTIERVIALGDLSKLSPEQRSSYYVEVCKSLQLNPLTKPFEYITLNGKLTLYARKDCADQLRRVHGVSIDKPDIRFEDDWIIVTVIARDQNGRCDSDIGVVNKKDMRGDFGNAVMKAVTKAKRRVTLSLCGLGMLDETEVETIPDAKIVIRTEVPQQLPPASETKLHRPPLGAQQGAQQLVTKFRACETLEAGKELKARAVEARDRGIYSDEEWKWIVTESTVAMKRIMAELEAQAKAETEGEMVGAGADDSIPY